jgi:hypothetical protein
VGFYRITIGSSADGSNSLAEESLVFRQFSNRFMFRSILEYLDNTWYMGTFDVSCMVVFEKGTTLGRKILNLTVGILKLLPFS